MRWFSEIGLEDVAHAAGKNASLGELCRELAAAGVRVPDGSPSPSAHHDLRGPLLSAGDERPLLVTASGEFVYLSSREPGKYVRVRRLDDRFTYLEHVDMPFGSVTFWGELRVDLER